MRHWITDPSFDNHDLSDYLCGPSAPPNASMTVCPLLRNCTFDAELAHDLTLNATCGIEGGCYTCLHKALWPPASGDLLLGVLLFMCGTLAGASGIGGGGLNVPLLMLAGGFLVSEAVPLSHVAVFGNAIAQNLINAPRSHPHNRHRPLIDLDIPLLMLPAQLGGNTLGVLISPTLPASGVELLACVLLSYAAIKTFVTATKTFKRETAEANARRLLDEATTDTGGGGGAGGGGGGDVVAGGGTLRTATKPLLGAAQTVPAPQPSSAAAVQVGIDGVGGGGGSVAAGGTGAAADVSRGSSLCDGRLGLLLSLWLAIVLCFLGSHNLATGGTCTAPRLAWLFGQLVLVTSAATGGALWLRASQARRDLALSPMLPGDIKWRRRNTTLLPIAGALVGLVAGLLGLGGGELMAPLLLAIGMLPQVASATSACMVLFTSSSDIAHYLFNGVLAPDPGYVAAALCLGFCSAMLGRLLALSLVKRLSHPSLIAYALGSGLVVALSLLAVQIARQKVDWTFANFCRP